MSVSEDRAERGVRDYLRAFYETDGDIAASVRAVLEARALEIAAAEARGRIAGLKEALAMAGNGHFLMKEPERIIDGVMFHIRQVKTAIDARIAELGEAPTAATKATVK